MGGRIDVLRAARGGELTAAELLADARDAASPLHAEFLWDDRAAAEQQRLNRARCLINGIVRVVVRSDGSAAQALQSLRVVKAVDRADGTTEHHSIYVAPAMAFSRAEYRERVYEDCRRQIAALEARLRLIAETEEILAALAEVRAKLDGAARRTPKRARHKGQPQPV